MRRDFASKTEAWLFYWRWTILLMESSIRDDYIQQIGHEQTPRSLLNGQRRFKSTLLELDKISEIRSNHGQAQFKRYPSSSWQVCILEITGSFAALQGRGSKDQARFGHIIENRHDIRFTTVATHHRVAIDVSRRHLHSASGTRTCRSLTSKKSLRIHLHTKPRSHANFASIHVKRPGTWLHYF